MKNQNEWGRFEWTLVNIVKTTLLRKESRDVVDRQWKHLPINSLAHSTQTNRVIVRVNPEKYVGKGLNV